MKAIYRNFDGLDVSFQGAVPMSVRQALSEAKDEAQKRRQSVLARLGPDEIMVMVAEAGARGGYAFRFDTGLDGETWFIADSDNADHWNIRVSVKSLNLALHGYEAVKGKLLSFLDQIGAYGPQMRGSVSAGKPIERISRFDFCVDFTAEAFRPTMDHFIAHSRTTRRENGPDACVPWERESRGRVTESLRLGQMPNRQVAMYNKTREITVSHKPYWWDLWALDKSEFAGEVWRVEARAGKAELDEWNLRRFDDFERMAGDVIVSILDAIRYVVPAASDSNPARWPMAAFWQDAIRAATDSLAPYTSNAERKRVITDYRDNIINRYRNLFPGLMASMTAALGKDASEVPEVMELVAADVLTFASHLPDRFAKKHQDASERFVFLDEAIAS